MGRGPEPPDPRGGRTMTAAITALLPLLLDRRAQAALAALLALAGGLLLGGGEAEAAVRYNPRMWGR